MNRFDCSIWLLACQITNVYRNEDLKIKLENNLYHYSVNILYLLFLRLEYDSSMVTFLSVPLSSTLSYGEGRMWQVTAYGQMICISP